MDNLIAILDKNTGNIEMAMYHEPLGTQNIHEVMSILNKFYNTKSQIDALFNLVSVHIIGESLNKSPLVAEYGCQFEVCKEYLDLPKDIQQKLYEEHVSGKYTTSFVRDDHDGYFKYEMYEHLSLQELAMDFYDVMYVIIWYNSKWRLFKKKEITNFKDGAQFLAYLNDM